MVAIWKPHSPQGKTTHHRITGQSPRAAELTNTQHAQQNHPRRTGVADAGKRAKGDQSRLRERAPDPARIGPGEQNVEGKGRHHRAEKGPPRQRLRDVAVAHGKAGELRNGVQKKFKMGGGYDNKLAARPDK